MPLPPEPLSVETVVDRPVEDVWEKFTNPEHVTKWNHALDDWHSPRGENDLRAGGTFNYRMEAKDGSEGFDFIGTYDAVAKPHRIEYTMDDGRQIIVIFSNVDGMTRLTETFEPELENPLEIQKVGWQAILDTFNAYAESST